jgi:hypothetical protein
MHIMTPNANRHYEDIDLERYSMRDLTDEDAASLEEHLLVCESCRGRLEETEAFVSGIQLAAKQLRVEEEARQESGWRRWLRLDRQPAGILAGCAAVLLLMVAYHGWPGDRVAPAAIVLQASRGAQSPAPAPAGKPLLLHPDLTSLPAQSQYRLEVVDASASTVWSGSVTPGGAAKVPPQRAADYFVRIFSSDGRLLREYPLPVRR